MSNKSTAPMNKSWLKITFPIALIFSFRMLGLFMLIPVFTIFAPHLEGATPFLIGIALGGYGLSQGLLQIPFGFWSDRFGRKPLIRLGLILFTLGSLIGAISDSIYSMILARILQGAGAIGSVLIALIADLTDEAVRTKAMAVVGSTIGLSFAIAVVLSPLLTDLSGLSSIFYFTAVLGVIGLVVLHVWVPSNAHEMPVAISKQGYFKTVLLDKKLWPLNLGIFCQHFILTASFFVIPLLLKDAQLNHLIHASWPLYLGWMLIGFLMMIPFIIIGEKKKLMPILFIISVGITLCAQLFLALGYLHFYVIVICMQIYFIAFNFLEASLPSFISKIAPKDKKGTAMGIYSTCQFLGIFFGGALSGIFYTYFDSRGVFVLNTILSMLWLALSRWHKAKL